jgi:2-polyprenyl-3-methyl-5-hydroxy-6-metoxy-1,4-benzoquinol methylase
VTFADREPDALAFAAWNATRLGAAERVTVLGVDWSRATVAGTFDVVVLADVTYRPLHHASLRHQLASCLAPGGVIVHADPHRREATPFVQWLQQQYACVTASRETSFLDKRAPIRLCVASTHADALADWRRPLGLDVATAASPPRAASAASATNASPR